MKDFYAHINKDGIAQSTTDHLWAVAELCSKFTSKIGMPKTGIMLGILHDSGKLCRLFNSYIVQSFAGEEVGHLKGRIDHSTIGARLLYESFGIDKLPVEILGNVILGHHGGLIDFLSPDGSSKLLDRIINKELPHYEECKNNFFSLVIKEKEFKELFKQVDSEVKDIIQRLKDLGGDLFLNLGLLIRYLFSCLIDADRTDTYRFMEAVDEDRAPDFSWKDFEQKLEQKIASFQVRFPIDIKRREISELCLHKGLNDNTGTYRLNVPTGGGKTLASMRYALGHRRIKNKERIFSFIPLTTIIDQTAEIYKDIFIDPSLDEHLILEHHSNIQTDSEEEQDLGYSINEERRKYLCERWESPIVLTTFVQFFNTFFTHGTKSVRRLHNMTNSILIFDEVQTVPVKLIYLFNAVVNFMSKIMDSTVILSTATQPTYEYLENSSYKMHVNPEGIIDKLGDISEDFKRVKLISRTHEKWTIDILADEAVDNIQKDETSILIIVNKRKTATQIYAALKERVDDKEVEVFHLSTNMIPKHRKKKIKEMLKVLKEGRKCICVSTQLIQAGVDVSFSMVYRDIAGMDSVVQSAGRGNRNGEKDFGIIYLIDLKDSEKHDKEILEQINSTRILLSAFSKDSRRFNDDLISEPAIQFYFRQHFSDVEDLMSYKVKEEGTDLVKLLSNNSGFDLDTSKYQGIRTRLRMAFATAAKYFKVIDSPRTTVICPYDNNATLSALRSGNLSGEELKTAMTTAQQYSIGLTEYELNKFKRLGAVSKDTNLEIYWLDTRFYDEETGLVLEPKVNRLSAENYTL